MAFFHESITVVKTTTCKFFSLLYHLGEKKILKLLYNYLFTFGKNLQKAYDLKHLKKTPCSRIKKRKKVMYHAVGQKKKVLYRGFVYT